MTSNGVADAFAAMQAAIDAELGTTPAPALMQATSASQDYAPYFHFGGTGNDTFTLPDSQFGGVGLGGSDHITGTGNNDFLIGDFFTLAYFDSFDSNGNQIKPMPAYDLSQKGNDVLYGGDGHDVLIADQGNDTLYGGALSDEFHVWSQNMGNDVFYGGGDDQYFDKLTFGDDWQIGFSYFVTGSLILNEASGIRELDFNGFGLHGTSGNDTFNFSNITYMSYAVGGATGQAISMGDGNDSFAGSWGMDSVNGGNGNDTLSDGNGGCVFYGAAGDDVLTDGSQSDLASSMYGGDGNDRMTSHGSSTTVADVVYGGNGNDSLTSAAPEYQYTIFYGDAGMDTLVGAANGDPLYGGADADLLQGNGGNDYLDGGTGNDTMEGGSGNDTYIVDYSGDVVSENSASGTDAVQTTLTSFVLAVNFENLSHTSTSAFSGSGNSSANSISGNSGADTLTGLDGNDVLSGGDGGDSLSGGSGHDSLSGGNGNDVLDGGADSDTMVGGAGNDSYSVDATGDVVSEAASSGVDTVSVSLASYTLGSNVENLVHSTTATFSGTGNTMANVMTGGNGIDTLNGMTGADTLTGAGSADHFAFTTALAASNIDTITDFQHGSDKFDLSHSVFTTLTTGALASTAFQLLGSAQDANDRIIYDQATGKVYYDADGSGAGAKVEFALVTAGTVLSATDFLVI